MNFTKTTLYKQALRDYPKLCKVSRDEQLAGLVDNVEKADVEFLVGDDGTPVYALKVFLTMRSSVFNSLLSGNFREALPPSSSASVATSASEISSPLPPIFWHRVEIRDMEPRTMRHLLHWCYTTRLHPDFFRQDDSSRSPTQQESDLVSLYVAADRYLLDKCKESVKCKFTLMLGKDDRNALSIFDVAFEFAPQLASLAQSCIAADATRFLSGKREETEAQWLAMSPAAAAQLVEGELENFKEVDLFRAVVRSYEHHRAEAYDASADNDDHDRRSAASATAREKVAGLLEGINPNLMSVDELSDVVEPSGLFTDAQLAAAYKQAAHNHRFIFHELPLGRLFSFEDRVRHGSIVWHLSVRVSWHDRKFYVKIAASKEVVMPPEAVSAEGVSVSIFRNRRCLVRYVASASTVVSVPGALCVPVPDNYGRAKGEATIIVHVPATAFKPSDRVLIQL
jgi:hypothetical protein